MTGPWILSSADNALAVRFDQRPHMLAVYAQGGPGPLRQAFMLWRQRRGRPGLRVQDFYGLALWRRDLSPGDRAAFVFPRANRALNEGLLHVPPGATPEPLHDKLAVAERLTAAGIACTPTWAVVVPGSDATHRHGVPVIASREGLDAFLADPAHFPLYGKPVDGSRSQGGVRVERADPATGGVPGQAWLSNGVAISLGDLAAQIVAAYPGGYLLQPVLRNAACLRPHLGTATAALRVVTLRTEAGIEPLYALIKLPSATAMHDGPTINARAKAAVDVATGRVALVRPHYDPTGRGQDHWQDPATPLRGLELPGHAAALEVVRRGHALFPDHGILGWDVLLTDDGPVVGETNANPNHMLHQMATLRGVLGPDLGALWARAQAFAAARRGG